MPFIKGNSSIEACLNLLSNNYDGLKDLEYMSLLNDWRLAFDDSLSIGEGVNGDKAMLAMEHLLPSDVFVFNFPGYKFLPASTNVKDKVYAYKVKGLSGIDRVVFNNNDSIVCDISFQYTCLYTHEWQSLGVPRYLNK